MQCVFVLVNMPESLPAKREFLVFFFFPFVEVGKQHTLLHSCQTRAPLWLLTRASQSWKESGTTAKDWAWKVSMVLSLTAQRRLLLQHSYQVEISRKIDDIYFIMGWLRKIRKHCMQKSCVFAKNVQYSRLVLTHRAHSSPSVPVVRIIAKQWNEFRLSHKSEVTPFPPPPLNKVMLCIVIHTSFGTP